MAAFETEAIAGSLKAITSGGSTGRPKLIVHQEPALYDPEPDTFVLRQGSVLVPGPMYHNGPFYWSILALFRGNRLTITTRFDAEQTLKLIDEHEVDTVYTVPTMMQRIWNLPEEKKRQYNLSSLVMLWHTAAPCPAWLKAAFIEWLGADKIWEVYGGTEGIGATFIGGHEWLQHKGSVGKPAPGTEMKIVNERGETLPPGQVGEIFMRPEKKGFRSYRYIGAKAKSLGDGWESFGDLGYVDNEGYLYIADRLTDMILSGGANIYPAEIEAAIDSFSGVRSSAVIGLSDEDMGNVVHAIVDAPGNDLTSEALLEHLSKRLVTYKLPRSIEFVAESLRDDAGKVRRKALREARIKPCP